MLDPFAFGPWVSAEAQAHFAREAKQPLAPPTIAEAREFYDRFNRRHLKVALELYPVDIVEQCVDALNVHVVTPAGGATNRAGLLCLHGGAFMWGSGAGALLEAVPIAAVTGMTVFAVDYRLAPEHRFPAAVDDALSVYRWLLEERPAESIGVYGCSAGGVLTAQVIARLLAEGQAPPAAIAMLHGTAIDFGGDAAAVAPYFDPRGAAGEVPGVETLPYFEQADLDDPLVLPGRHQVSLTGFPPSLLVTGSRDFAASAMAVMHRRLLGAGIAAQFVQFDGMWHAHHMATDLPESRETFDLVARFFSAHLG